LRLRVLGSRLISIFAKVRDRFVRKLSDSDERASTQDHEVAVRHSNQFIRHGKLPAA
jgi:hypothetical protein